MYFTSAIASLLIKLIAGSVDDKYNERKINFKNVHIQKT